MVGQKTMVLAMGDAVGDDDGGVVVPIGVLAVGDGVAEGVELAGCGAPPLADVGFDAADVEGGEEAIVNALGEAVTVDGGAKVGGVGGVLGLLRGGGHTDLPGGGEVVEDFAPTAVVAGGAAMAFVNDDEIEEVRREEEIGTHGLVDVRFFLLLLVPVAIKLMIETKVDLVGGVAGTILEVFVEVYLVADTGERGKVIGLGLVDQDIAVGKEEDAAAGAALEEAPDDLEGDEGLAGAGGKDQQEAPLALGDGREGIRDGAPLVITRGLGRSRADVIRLAEEFGLVLGERRAVVAVTQKARIKRIGRGELIHGEFALLTGEQIIFLEGLAVGGIGERGSAKLGVADGLLEAKRRQGIHPFGLNHGNGICIRVMPKQVIRALFAATFLLAVP